MNPNSFVVVVRDGTGVRHERVRLSAEQALLVGRGWNCDIILQDPQVDPEHAELRLGDDGLFRLIDLGSLNGARINGAKVNAAIDTGAEDFRSGSVIGLGRSQLSVYLPDHEVAAAVEPSRWDAIRVQLERPVWAVVSVAAFCAVALLDRLAENVKPLSAETFIGVAGLLAFGLGLWVLFWGVLTKLWRNAMHLRAHLSIAAVAGVLAYFVGQLGRYVGWQTQSIDASALVSTLGEAGLLFLTLGLTLGVATRLHRRPILWLASVPGVLLILSTYVMPMLEDEDVEWYPSLVTTSYPPGWQVSGGEPLENFLSDTPRLYEKTTERAHKRATELATE